jgi:NAD(P)H dehydrogenase (quinone)
VVVGDLLEPADVYRAVQGTRRGYFGMSVSAGYLEATLTMAAVARDVGIEALVNMSQMTVSEMDVRNTTPSHQQRQHWLGEQAIQWSGLPVVTVRPTRDRTWGGCTNSPARGRKT